MDEEGLDALAELSVPEGGTDGPAARSALVAAAKERIRKKQDLFKKSIKKVKHLQRK